MYYTTEKVVLRQGELPIDVRVSIDDKEGAFISLKDLKGIFQQSRAKVLADVCVPETYRECFVAVSEWNLALLDEISANFKR